MQQIYRKIDILVQTKKLHDEINNVKTKTWFCISFIHFSNLRLYAFYVDEGKNNFNGILEFTNLFFLGVYVLLFFVNRSLFKSDWEA